MNKSLFLLLYVVSYLFLHFFIVHYLHKKPVDSRKDQQLIHLVDKLASLEGRIAGIAEKTEKHISIYKERAIHYQLKKMEITGYSTDDVSINVPKWRDGRTASGKLVISGYCAADWSIYPKGTIFIIPDFGLCRVEDKGGAIKADKIDIFFLTARAAKLWGRRKNVMVGVYLYNHKIIEKEN